MKQMGVITKLWRRYLCLWDVCLDEDPWGNTGSDVDNDVSRVKAESIGPCENGKYVGYSFHFMVDYENTRWTAATSKRADVNNC